MLVPRPQGLQGVHPRVETGGHQAGEPTRARGTVRRLGAPRVRALADTPLQGPLHQRVVEGSADDGAPSPQGLPMALPRGSRFPPRAVGFPQALLHLLVEPTWPLVHDRTARGLVVRATRRGAHLLVAGLCIMVQHLLERLDDHPARRRQHGCQSAALATAMGQTVAAHPLVCVRCMTRERVGHDQRSAQVRLALRSEGREVCPRRRPTCIRATERALTHPDHQGGGLHACAVLRPRDALGLRVRLRVVMLCHQREAPHRRVVLGDQLPLGGEALQRLQHHRATVSHPLDLLPLRGLGDRHPDHGVIACEPGPRQAHRGAPHRQDGPRPWTRLRRTGVHGPRRRAHVPTRGAVPRLALRADGGQEGMPVHAARHPRRHARESPLATHGAALADRSCLMAALDPLGPLGGLHPQAAIPWTMAPSTRGGDLIARRPPARPQPGGGGALRVASTGRPPARRGPRRHAVAAPLPTDKRLQPLARDLRLTPHRQQPLRPPQHALPSPPVLLLPLPRAEPLAQGRDLGEVRRDVVGLAHGGHPSLLHMRGYPGLQRSPSGVVPLHRPVNAAACSRSAAGQTCP